MMGLRQILRMFEGNPKLQAAFRAVWREVHDDNVIERIVQVDHGFTIGQAVKINPGSGLWVLSFADTAANAGTIGLISRVYDADTFDVRTGGILSGTNTPGAKYYLSATSAGDIFAQTVPEVWGTGQVREFIGTGTSKGLQLEIDQVAGDSAYVYVAYASDASGTGFTLDPESKLPYQAILKSSVEIPIPAVGDFVGLWRSSGNNAESGNGMDFGTDEPVTLGLPSEINSTTVNAVTATSHTHKLGDVSVGSVADGDPLEYGALYNPYVLSDSRKITSSDEWIIPISAQTYSLWNALGSTSQERSNNAREVGDAFWVAPNTGATNSSGFNARGSGLRSSGFGNLKGSLSYFCYVGVDVRVTNINLTQFNDNYLLNTIHDGRSIRLARTSTSLSNRQTGTYRGNDGKTYRTICIGGVEWLADNLNETKYRNGDWIHGFDNGTYTPISNAVWEALTTEAMCYHGDNEAYGGGTTLLSTILEDLQEQIDAIPDAVSGSDTFMLHLIFDAAGDIVYPCPYALKFTAMIHQQTNAPTLSVTLNTDMAQYDDLTVTADAAGIVTLTATWL